MALDSLAGAGLTGSGLPDFIRQTMPTFGLWPTGPLDNLAHQKTNARLPTNLPPYMEFLDAYRRGWVGDNLFRAISARHGVPTDPMSGVGSDSQNFLAWTRVRQAGHRDIPPAQAWRLFLLGKINFDRLMLSLRRAGVHETDALLWHDLMRVAPDPMLILGAAAADLMTEVDASKLLAHHGGKWEDWGRVMPLLQRPPTLAESFSMRRRDLMSRQEFEQNLKRLGVADERWRGWLTTMLDEIPPISDLIRFQVREAFSPAIANQIGLYDESPVQAADWMRKQGYGGDAGFDIVSDGIARPANWTDLYWAAHWQPISPTQVYHMLHRLRPDRVERYRAQGFNVQAFGINDVRRWLRIADYPPQIRDYLAAIAYTPMRLVDIRAKLRLNPDRATQVWAHDQLQDRGMHPDDAWDNVRAWVDGEAAKARAWAKRVEQAAPAKLWAETERGYKLGTVTRDDARDIGRTVGLQAEAVNATLGTLDAARKNGIVRASVSTVRSKFLSGVLQRGEAKSQLTSSGIGAERANEYLDLWEIQRDGPRKALSVSESMDLMKRGLITPADAAQRLQNLGYRDVDGILLIARGAAELGEIQARAAASELKRRQAQAKELQAQIKAADALARRMRNDLRSLTPVATLKAWARKGVIGEDYFRARLAAMGYDPQTVDLYWSQVVIEELEEQADEEAGADEGGEGGAPGGGAPGGGTA